ncbi:hypothetical protein ANPL_02745 [Anaplasma platys]|uniref:Uncharacterized protein n=1 Tax=Anaplasma platys TaxID=949 RepID=A0A858PYD4_9RICK|nr:hypothetical protein [Anaplasma platys]QJC27611.1 hypothetical protein ANPL_02745 [Anaplasma platys]
MRIVEHHPVHTHSGNKNAYEDPAKVVMGASSTLSDKKLSHGQLIKVLRSLLTRSREVTAAILKESTRSHYYDDDCSKQRRICCAYGNTTIVLENIAELLTQKRAFMDQELREFYWEMCLYRLYVTLDDVGRFLDQKILQIEVDLMYWHAEQVLVLIVNAIDLIQTHAFEDESPQRKKEYGESSAFYSKTTQMLEVVNRAVNRLRLKNETHMTNLTMIYRTAGELNVLHKLVRGAEFFALWPSETGVLQDLIGKRLGVLTAQLSLIMSPRFEKREGRNVLLCQVANTTLFCYEIAAYRAIDCYPPAQPHDENHSLAFSLIENISLALETSICSSDQQESPEQNRAARLDMIRKISRVCNVIYAAITSYYKQLLLQEILRSEAEMTGYNSCLDELESALQKVRNIRSQAATLSDVTNKNLQTLEESLTKSGRLCASTMQNEALFTKNGHCFRNLFNEELSVLSYFYTADNTSPSTLLDSIEEEMYLQGRGWELELI